MNPSPHARPQAGRFAFGRAIAVDRGRAGPYNERQPAGGESMAKLRYEEIDAIVHYVVMARSRCWNTVPQHPLSEEDARVKAFRKEYDAAFDKSLPKKRIGW